VKDRERVGGGGKGVNYKWLYDKGYAFGSGNVSGNAMGEGFAGVGSGMGGGRGLASSQSMHF
jgi:hypothetical protein